MEESKKLCASAPLRETRLISSPAELADELESRCKSAVIVMEMIDGTYLVRIKGSRKQYELLTAIQALKAGELPK